MEAVRLRSRAPRPSAPRADESQDAGEARATLARVTAGPLEIGARAGSARAGVLRLPHGEVRTPAFIPLASTATVKTLDASEVEALGYDIVLGNTFHLVLQPAADLIGRMGGLHELMGWPRPIIPNPVG